MPTYFFLGAFTLIQQTIILREIFVVVSGNELSFGITLANWLAGVFAGSAAGGFFVDRIRRVKPAFVSVVWLLCLASPLMISLSRLIRVLSPATAGTTLPFIQVFAYSALATQPFSFLIGFAFPLAVRIGPNDGSPPAGRISRIYITEAFGSLCSGLLYTFFLVERLDSFSIVTVFTLPLIAFSLLLLPRRSSPVMRSFGILLLLSGTLAVAFRLPGRWHEWLGQKRWQSISSLSRVEARDTKFQNLQLGEAYGQFSLFANGQLSVIFPNDDENRILAAHLTSQHPSPKRILVIGEAVSGLGFWLLKFPVERVESVEIDPLLLGIIRRNLDLKNRRALEDGRFNLVTGDGREYVRKLIRPGGRNGESPKWDVVFIAEAEPSTTLLNRYYTREFFSDIAKILKDDGVLALRITASENYAAGIVGQYGSSIYQTLESVFPFLVVSPGMIQTFFASRTWGSVSDSPDILARRYRRSGVEPAALGDIFLSLYPEEKTRFTRTALRAGPAAVNSDEKPISCFYYNKILGWYGGKGGGRLLEFFEKRVTPRLLLLLLTAMAGFLLLIRARILSPGSSRRLAILYAAAVAGFSGLSLEMTIIHTFQVRLGYAYRTIGLLIAMFMMGLAVGARQSSGRRSGLRRLLVVQLFMGGFAVGYPFLLRLLSDNRVFLTLIIPAAMIAAGFLVGALFPLTVETLLRSGMKEGRTTGGVNALDHMGAALGAILPSALFLPVLGIVGNGLIIGALCVSSVLLLAAAFSMDDGTPGIHLRS